MVMEWSEYSLALFDKFQTSDSNLIVSACPGSGKTTNIKHLWNNVISDDKAVCYLVFNVANKNEAIGKLEARANGRIHTLNGLGYGAIIKAYGSRVKLDTDKVFKIIREKIFPKRKLNSQQFKEENAKITSLKKAVSMMKINGQVDTLAFDDLCEMYDIDEYQGLYQDASRVLAISDARSNYVIDFDDQIRIPVIADLDLPFDVDEVLGDEVQDWSSIQLQLVSKLTGRFTLVGDPHQAIYGFRGAMSNSMQVIKEYFDCVELPLKLTYRCAKRIVNEASKLFDDIIALDNAPEGDVYQCDVEALESKVFNKDMLIVCRYNAPLLALAYRLLARDIACSVKGREIGQGLVMLVDKLMCHAPAQTIGWLETNLVEWYKTESGKCKDSGANGIRKRAAIEDKYSSLLVFVDRFHHHEPVEHVKHAIEGLFVDGKGVVLSTVHKAKGLEAERVVILDHARIQSRYATQQWELAQERNIEYVAVTRAKHTLVLG